LLSIAFLEDVSREPFAARNDHLAIETSNPNWSALEQLFSIRTISTPKLVEKRFYVVVTSSLALGAGFDRRMGICASCESER
jgi:hypothetical protein